ncbi:MAG: ribbon-helix-helix domain-containing protein [Oscillospiraceae bacterium]|nr:ribbon-helix-helix domain-containing protein [Oscillospiraceae bacterium]
MDKKYIERPKAFDKKEYDKEYKKKHYKQFTVAVTPEFKERIDNYCKRAGISKYEFLKQAIEMFEEKN